MLEKMTENLKKKFTFDWSIECMTCYSKKLQVLTPINPKYAFLHIDICIPSLASS